MIASELFLSRPKQAQLFAFLVKGALAGNELTEKDVRRECFPDPPYKPASTIARTTVILARTLAHEYYQSVGNGDRVLIELPAGKPGKKHQVAGSFYRPVFSYNRRHPLTQHYRLGCLCLRARTPFDPVDAANYFDKVIELDPNFAAAHVGKAEAACLMAFLFCDSWEFISDACAHAKIAVDLDPNNWHTHAALGASRMLACELESAAAAFKNAYALNEAKTIRYGWYHAFQAANGRVAYAVQFGRLYAIEHEEDAYAVAMFGAYLYLARDYSNASFVIKRAIDLDLNCWVAYLVSALIQFSCGKAEEAFVPLRYMQHSAHMIEESYFFPGLAALLSAAAAHKFDPSAYTTAARLIRKEASPIYTQLTLWLMGSENSETRTEIALTALRCAWETYEPLVLFLHLLPLFDALREQEKFQSIAKSRFFVRPKPLSAAAQGWPDLFDHLPGKSSESPPDDTPPAKTE